MAVNYYRKDSNARVAKNFRAHEFACKASGCGEEFPLDDRLVTWLQQIRDHFGQPVQISSGYRCEKHNAQAGGAPNSYHTRGMAADIWIPALLHEPRTIARYAESIGIRGIGLYEGSRGQYFVHIDTRENRVFWEGHEERLVSTFREKTVNVPLRVLKQGSKGTDVKAMQLLLGGYGWNCAADGSFGDDTHSKLTAYQAANGLEADGSCGPATWASLLGRS